MIIYVVYYIYFILVFHLLNVDTQFSEPKDGEDSSAPRIIESVQSMSAPDGSQIQFVCKVEGSPRPQITWFRQTAIIKPSQDFQISYYDGDNKATLVIKEVFPEDAGTFTCVAKNCIGFASSSAELIVEHPLSEHGSGMMEKHDRYVTCSKFFLSVQFSIEYTLL